MLDVRDHIEVVRENIITTKRTKQLKDIKIKNINYICFFFKFEYIFEALCWR